MLVGSAGRLEVEGAVWTLILAEMVEESGLRLVEAAVELPARRGLDRMHFVRLALRVRGGDHLWVVATAHSRMIEIASYRSGMDRNPRRLLAADSVVQMAEEGAWIVKELEAQLSEGVVAELEVRHQAVEVVVRMVSKMAAVVEELGVRPLELAALEQAMLAVEGPYQMASERTEEEWEASCQSAGVALVSRLYSRPAIPQA